MKALVLINDPPYGARTQRETELCVCQRTDPVAAKG